MKILNMAVAVAIALPTAALAQQAEPHASHSSMTGCEHDADGKMTGCDHMDGDHAMNHGDTGHQGMDHRNMNHDQTPSDEGDDTQAPDSMDAE